MPYIATPDGTQIFYNDWGAGPPVVLVHGWPLTSDMWSYQALFLAENGFRVIAYDRRGFGRSGQPWDGYDYDTLADDLATLLDKLDLRDAALVGFSMGGGEVARYIARHGTSRLNRAALIAAVTPYLSKTADNPEGIEQTVFQQIIDGLQSDRPHFLATFGKAVFGQHLLRRRVSDETLLWTLKMALDSSARATLECVCAWSTTDFRADIAKMQLPTLLIHGTADETVPIGKSAKRVAKIAPAATFLRYEDQPHGLFITAKDRLNDDLLSFLAG